MGVLCAVVGGMSAPATAAAPADMSPKALIQLAFTNVSNNQQLDVQNYMDIPVISVNPVPGNSQTWRVNTSSSDGSFAIANTTTGKCVDVSYAGYNLRQQPCDGRATEQWYFQPVAGSAQNAFRVRAVSDNLCLSVQIPPGTDNLVYTMTCDNSQYQQWTLPAQASTVARDSAITYAAHRCAKDSSTCSWNTISQQKPGLLPEVCVSQVWHNSTTDSIPWKFTLNTSTGWATKVGGSFSTSFTAGSDLLPLKAQLTTTITAEVSMDLRQDLGNTLDITVHPNDYGWVSLSELATQVTGTWTFDAQGFPWTVDDTVTVPLKTAPHIGASIYNAHTSRTFTSCDGTA